jgi:hypothetical protein
MTIHADDVRKLLAHDDAEAALVLIEGRVEVKTPAELDSADYAGAMPVVTRRQLVEQAGTAELSDRELAEHAETLDAAVRNLGG